MVTDMFSKHIIHDEHIGNHKYNVCMHCVCKKVQNGEFDNNIPFL